MSKNAKFEEWARGEGYLVYPGSDGYVYSSMSVECANKGWQAAIQSLEVTPEVVELALITYYAGDADQRNIPNMTAALTAVFNAIKEQAK